MAELLADVPGMALAVYAHPDDAEVSCGGTLARWARAGADVHVVVCTKGDKGATDADVDGRTLTRRRRREMAAAAEVLGLAGHHVLGHSDGEVENDQRLRRELVELIRRLRPDALLCPDPTAVFFGQTYFNHRDHRAVGWAALDASFPAAAQPHYFPGTGEPHQVPVAYLSGTLEADVWVDISDTIETKAAALACHESQVGEAGEWLRRFVQQRAEDAGRASGVGYAEGFRRLLAGS